MAYLDPSLTGSLEQAQQYLNQESQRRQQRDLTPEEFQNLATQVGYTGGNVTGTQYNQALDVMGWGDSGGTTGVPSPTPAPSTGTPQPTAPIVAPTTTAPAPTTPEPVPAPTTATPAPAPTTVDPNAALAQVSQKFTSKFGRAMTPEEQQMATSYAQQLGWNGTGPVRQSVLDRVLAQVDQYQPTAPTAPTVPGAPTTPAVAGTVDPNAALTQVQSAFQTKFGRAMTPEEQQALIQYVGYGGGPVTPDALQKALAAVQQYSGSLANPWGPAPPAAPAGPAPATQAQVDQATLDRLNELLGLSWGEVDPNSPAMRQQRQAFERATQRGREQKRAALAERAAARGGLGAGGFDVDVERLLQQEGEANQAYGANLMAQELGTQREALQNAIKMAADLGQTEKARALQDKLGTLDIKLREFLGRGQLGLGLLSAKQRAAEAAAGNQQFYAKLGAENQQFYDQLGLQLANLQNVMNNQAISALFGGT
jgi:hypothetical protein